MDVFLTILFYIYLGLALSAPFLVIPAILICRKLAYPRWNGLVVLIPLLGLLLFAFMIKLPRVSQSRPA